MYRRWLSALVVIVLLCSTLIVIGDFPGARLMILVYVLLGGFVFALLISNMLNYRNSKGRL